MKKLHRTSLANQTKETIAEGLTTPNFIITDRYIFILEGLSMESKSYTEICNGTFEIVVDGDLFKAILTFRKYVEI